MVELSTLAVSSTVAMPSLDPPADAQAIARLWRADESECVPPLIRAAQLDDVARERSALVARELIEGMRRTKAGVASRR
jgi:RHH-type proline utilization regulon transcriptional repressor/proline dehydrogenase/delta 1-pyrroline-5-carboxylate dehydrogenase